jgi:hypothetical protein
MGGDAFSGSSSLAQEMLSDVLPCRSAFITDLRETMQKAGVIDKPDVYFPHGSNRQNINRACPKPFRPVKMFFDEPSIGNILKAQNARHHETGKSRQKYPLMCRHFIQRNGDKARRPSQGPVPDNSPAVLPYQLTR